MNGHNNKSNVQKQISRKVSRDKKKTHDEFGDLVSIPKDLFNVTNQIYKVRQVVDYSTIAQQATLSTFGAFQFQLSDLDQAVTFTTLFDQYKIDFLELKLRPNANLAQVVNPSTGQIMPLLYTAVDYDDANVPTSLAYVREYQSCKETRFDNDCVRKFKPRIALAAYSGTFVSFANQTSWLDCASATVKHYGVKYAISPALTGQGNLQTWTVEARYYISFRQIR